MKPASANKKSLYREITIALVALVSVVSITVGFLNYLYQVREAAALYEYKSAEYADHLRDALEWPLWNIDDELIGKIGSTFTSNVEITWLTIRDDQQRVVYHHEKPAEKQSKRVLVIRHDGHNIGSVEFGVSLATYEAKDRQLLLASIISMALLIVVLLGATRWILSRLLQQPVDAFVGATSDMVEGKYRQIELPETYVEFSPVLAGFKTMSDAVANRESSLRQINEHLAMEIDERKRVGEALRVNEERLKLATGAGNIGIWDWDVVNNELTWDESMYSLYGIRKEDFGGAYDAWISTLHPDDRQFTDGEIQAALRGEREYAPEFRIVHPDGTSRNIKASSKTYCDAQGKPLRMVGTNIDITERKRVQDVAQAASQYSRSLIEASLDPLVTISAEGKITDVNHATEEVTDRRRSELIGTDFSDYFTEPDKAREGYQQAFLKGYVTDYPLVLRHRDGHVTEVLYNASVYRDEAGEVLGVFAAARDVTERNKAEREVAQLSLRNKLILDSAGEGIYGLDIDGRCTFVNPAALQLLGFSIEELIGQYSHAMIHHSQQDCPVQSAYKQGVVHRGSDRYWRKDGGSFPVEFISTPILEAGEITGAVVAFRDITELKEAEEKITELNRDLERRVVERTAQLEAVNRELEAFSYSISHDLRTPLRAIDGFSHILLDDYADKLDDEGKRLLNVVRNNTHRMGQLIDDILKFSRSGRAAITYSEIDMEKLARTVFEELQTSAVDEKLQIEIEHIPPARGDGAMMHQVFINLISNAIKFSHIREVAKIKVGGSIEGDEAVYFVRDNGVGFNMQYADKLFGVFQRLHSSEEFEGTGIGLAIVKRVISRHGGRVWAEGKVNEGATIYFALPTKGG